MQIVVLDAYSLNPGDLSWASLEEFGDCRIYDRTPDELVIERACNAKIVLTNKVPITRELMNKLPELRYIGVLATGYNIVDTTAAREHNITVTNVPAYGTSSVAQMTFALLLELTQHVGYHSQTVREGRWSSNPDFCYWDYPLIELEGLTMGLVGFGKIAKATAKLARAFGMHVIAYSPEIAPDAATDTELTDDISSLFSRSDVLSLHCPLTDDNKGMVNAERLALMKPGALMINTARGPLIDEQALADALNAERIAGAGLDVLSVEPADPQNPLLKAKNCLITPHIAWATRSARIRLMQTVINNIKAYTAGKPENVVNP